MNKDPMAKEIYDYMLRQITIEYFDYGIRCTLGEYFPQYTTDTPLEMKMVELFSYTRDQLLKVHYTDYDPGVSHSAISLMYKEIMRKNPKEARDIFFRWVRYYNGTRVGKFEKIPVDVFGRIITDQRPDLDEWGVQRAYFVPLD